MSKATKPNKADTRDRSKPKPNGVWFDKRSVAARYAISESSVDRYVNEGLLPKPSKFGRLCRWHASQLAEFDEALLSQEG